MAARRRREGMERVCWSDMSDGGRGWGALVEARVERIIVGRRSRRRISY